MAIAAQENQGFQHRVRHGGTVWAHYDLWTHSVKICVRLEQTMPAHTKTCSNNGLRSGNLLHADRHIIVELLILHFGEKLEELLLRVIIGSVMLSRCTW